ncbi:MAG TPA: hypothetical protein VGA73_05020 [Candidatus Binatia bacterium]
MRRYRKQPGDGTGWHFSPQCSQWPVKDYVERHDRPPIEDICDDCISSYAAEVIEEMSRRPPIRW